MWQLPQSIIDHSRSLNIIVYGIIVVGILKYTHVSGNRIMMIRVTLLLSLGVII